MYINIFATMTSSDNQSVTGEARLSMLDSFVACEAVNSASDTYSYTLLRKSETHGLTLLKVQATDSGSFYVANQMSIQVNYNLSAKRTVNFIETDQFLLGGTYGLEEGTVGLVLNAVESRRSSSNDMWQSSTSASYSSFGSTSAFATDLVSVRNQLTQSSRSVSSVRSTTPVDYHEYANAKVFEDESS